MICKTLGATTKRYWRVRTSASPDTLNLELGVVFLGSYYELGETPDPPYRDSRGDQVLVPPAPRSNAARVDKGAPFSERSLSWQRADLTMRDTIVTVWESQGGRMRPLICVDHQETGITVPSYPGLAYENGRYVTMRNLVTRATLPAGRHSIEFDLKDVT